MPLPDSTPQPDPKSPPRPVTDVLDLLRSQWQKERPEFDTAAMGIVGRIIVLGQKYVSDVEAGLSNDGLGYSDFDILATLRRSGAPYTLTPTELRSTVLLSSGAMTAALDRLESLSLIRRHPDEKDRRKKAAQLTEDGVRLAERTASMRFSIADRALETLPLEEREALELLLKKLLRAV